MSKGNAVAVGIDIGGTTVKLGLVQADGGVLARRRLAYSAFASFDAMADMLATQTRAMESEVQRKADAVGVAAPGHAQAADGLMVDGTANVPLLRDRSLASALRDRLGISIATVNDGTAAALGELCFGAGRGMKRFVVVTFGTGVGGGVVIDGRVITGADGEPPELGAMVLDAGAKAPRTLEEFACASGFASAYQRHGGPIPLPPQDIFGRAASGEDAASRAIEETCRRIAQGLGTLINILNLQACLIGGGIAQAGRPLLDPIRRSLPDFTWPYLLSRARVELAATGVDAGILGAAAIALGSQGDARRP